VGRGNGGTAPGTRSDDGVVGEVGNREVGGLAGGLAGRGGRVTGWVVARGQGWVELIWATKEGVGFYGTEEATIEFRNA